MKPRYFPNEIESKWQKKWQEQGLYKFQWNEKKKKYYNLVELPYPSGDLHLGHWFAFTSADAHARFKKMSGFNVFFPNGFDAFGLPAENAAIKKGIHPKDWTMKNIENMTKQFQTMGTMIDWNYTAITCLPEYYKWNQWIFLKMFEKGLAYRGKALSNWCPVDNTVLANEHIEAGKCWRCGTEVIQKEVEQWFLKITDYADKLIWPENPKVDWPKEVREGQNNWIGKSEGLLIDFGGIEVFTTRPETADGATFLVVAPEHTFVKDIFSEEVQDYIKEASKKTEMERKEDRTKSGVFTGKYVKNPITNKDIPVWISDYVLAGYGTGAIMAVPFADERDREFAEKFKLPTVETSFQAEPVGKKWVNYHLRDWSISRQRYWGTPVPVIHCEKCGLVKVPYEDLPVELPYNVDYAPKGKPPLATDEEWLNAKCPKCGGNAKRDAETLDTFFDSSWYFYRYVCPNYNKAPFEKQEVAKLMPVDIYFGGAEHTLGHTLYARFFTRFFKELGLVSFDEFALKRAQHGVILGPDGNRMSKSRGNVVNPDEVVKEYGADAVRLYLSFMMPFEATAPWSTTAINGIYRFLKRVWDLQNKIQNSKFKIQSSLNKEDLNQMHKAIKKIGDDLENLNFNTAISELMIWLNFLSAKKEIVTEEYETFLKLLSPFAPYITEEIWQSLNPSAKSIHLESWPIFNQQYLVADEVAIVVQVNGRVRDTIRVESSKLKVQSHVEEKARKSEKVNKYLEANQIKKVVYVEGKIINFVVG
jgi:leucyl-tRNA synthetase